MIPFTKMHGIGNDFVLINGFSVQLEELALPALAQKMCDRKFGVGADGLILASSGDELDYRMRMFNPDGSESEMCGNGVRCFLKFLHQSKLTHERDLQVETGAGPLRLVLHDDGLVEVDMGPARLSTAEIGMTSGSSEPFINQPIQAADATYHATAVSMGNPHIVIFVPDAWAIQLDQIGPELERCDLFPNRTNVHFVQVVSREHLIQRTWERGAGITLACGTGACACGVAAFLNGHADRKVNIDLPGGRLKIIYGEDGRVTMIGPAESVFVGNFA